jgi:hypothetical protein
MKIELFGFVDENKSLGSLLLVHSVANNGCCLKTNNMRGREKALTSQKIPAAY